MFIYNNYINTFNFFNYKTVNMILYICIYCFKINIYCINDYIY